MSKNDDVWERERERENAELSCSGKRAWENHNILGVKIDTLRRCESMGCNGIPRFPVSGKILLFAEIFYFQMNTFLVKKGFCGFEAAESVWTIRKNVLYFFSNVLNKFILEKWFLLLVKIGKDKFFSKFFPDFEIHFRYIPICGYISEV